MIELQQKKIGLARLGMENLTKEELRVQNLKVVDVLEHVGIWTKLTT